MEFRIKLIGDYTPKVRAYTASPKALELSQKERGNFGRHAVEASAASDL